MSVRILVVDDEEPVRYMFSRFIGDLCSRIAEAVSLKDAIAISKQEDFDIIILDLRLTDADKNQTLAAIPELRRKSGAAVIVVTGVPEPDIQEQAIRAGADYCISKNDVFTQKAKAILMALHAAVLKHPRPHAGDSYLRHVEMLERLVHDPIEPTAAPQPKQHV